MSTQPVNKVTLIGNLGNDPKFVIRENFKCCHFSIATNESFENRHGHIQQVTEWHRIVMFSELVDIAQNCLKKGNQILVEGKLRTRKWKTDAGEERFITEVVAEKWEILKTLNGPIDSSVKPSFPLTDVTF